MLKHASVHSFIWLKWTFCFSWGIKPFYNSIEMQFSMLIYTIHTTHKNMATFENLDAREIKNFNS